MPDDDTALRALVGIRSHLALGGSVMLPLFVPEPTPAAAFGRSRSHLAEDGTEMRITPVSEARDEAARRQSTVLRYENDKAAGSVVEERPWTLHWYSRAGIRALVEAADLVVVRELSTAGGPAGEDDTSIVLILHAAEVRCVARLSRCGGPRPPGGRRLGASIAYQSVGTGGSTRP